jgi:hypothetical protein
MKDGHHVYIGDGVYMQYVDGRFVIKANSHVDPTDTIYLEEDVMIEMIKLAIATLKESYSYAETPE